jgi:hypothetical protein
MGCENLLDGRRVVARPSIDCVVAVQAGVTSSRA